jgi:hypothetical protein
VIAASTSMIMIAASRKNAARSMSNGGRGMPHHQAGSMM